MARKMRHTRHRYGAIGSRNPTEARTGQENISGTAVAKNKERVSADAPWPSDAHSIVKDSKGRYIGYVKEARYLGSDNVYYEGYDKLGNLIVQHGYGPKSCAHLVAKKLGYI